MRGKVIKIEKIGIFHGITPAHAGKRKSSGLLEPFKQDHPRACGEKPNLYKPTLWAKGSPPRMRGKETLDNRAASPDGITPAHAGKSLPLVQSWCGVWDHPRACGEKGS